MDWAKSLVEVSDEQMEVIKGTKKALLYSEGQPWTKKGDVPFDIPMGSFDIYIYMYICIYSRKNLNWTYFCVKNVTC